MVRCKLIIIVLFSLCLYVQQGAAYMRQFPIESEQGLTTLRDSIPLDDTAKEYKHTAVAIKTNLLYDAVSVVNFAVELPFNHDFSFVYEHNFPWWLSSNNKYCLQFLSMGGEFRWWFKPQTKLDGYKKSRRGSNYLQRDALQGHFVGVYGFGGKTDIQKEREYCYQAEFFSAGITYGYSMPVGRRLNMEFSISVGYAHIPYQHYFPSEDFEILFRDPDPEKSGTVHYFGPTKVQVSLIVPLYFKNNKAVRKGGVELW